MGKNMTEFVKVCVKVPVGKEFKVKKLASKLRAKSGSKREPGWDSKVIHKISRDKFGGLKRMFEFHSWPERGDKMMPSVQRHVVEEYGSVEKFAKAHGTAS